MALYLYLYMFTDGRLLILLQIGSQPIVGSEQYLQPKFEMEHKYYLGGSTNIIWEGAQILFGRENK